MKLTEFIDERYKNRKDKDNIFGVGVSDAEFRAFVNYHKGLRPMWLRETRRSASQDKHMPSIRYDPDYVKPRTAFDT